MLDGMRALIVYESMFGGTRDIARAIAAGLRTAVPVDVHGVGDTPGTLGAVGDDVSLLIVGAPTHPGGLSRPRSRAAARSEVSGAVVQKGTLTCIVDRQWAPGGKRFPAGSTRTDSGTNNCGL